MYRLGPVLHLLTIMALFLFACSQTRSIGIAWNQEESHPMEPSPALHPGHGPPPHAPAWGYRAKYRYRYYPDAFVYFDIDRKIYFYLEGSNWKVSASLPSYYKSRLENYVVIEKESDTPYLNFKEDKKLYPPGRWKKQRHYPHGRWKNKRK